LVAVAVAAAMMVPQVQDYQEAVAVVEDAVTVVEPARLDKVITVAAVQADLIHKAWAVAVVQVQLAATAAQIFQEMAE
jgi:hypothetical protein